MAVIDFCAYNGTNKTHGQTAQEAVRLFLAQYKNRTFRVSEYRDGVHTTIISLKSGAEETHPEACFSRKFTSRDEARQFCQEAPST